MPEVVERVIDEESADIFKHTAKEKERRAVMKKRSGH